MRIAKLLNYRLIITCDFNGRIKEISGDKINNNMSKNKFLPFINMNNLKILNIVKHKGAPTCIKDEGNSIVDYVLTDIHSDWQNIYKINMKISKLQFKDKACKTSDHRPILINIIIDTKKLLTNKTINSSNNYRINYPNYSIFLTKNDEILSKSMRILEQNLKEDKSFNNLLNLNVPLKHIKYIDIKLKKNTLVNCAIY